MAMSRCSRDRKSTRLNSSHTIISYAVFCLKKKSVDRKSTRLNSSHTISSYAVFCLKNEEAQGVGRRQEGRPPGEQGGHGAPPRPPATTPTTPPTFPKEPIPYLPDGLPFFFLIIRRPLSSPFFPARTLST